MQHELQPLLSNENQAALVFAAAGEMSDHPPERVAAYIGGTVGTLSNWRKGTPGLSEYCVSGIVALTTIHRSSRRTRND